MLLPGTITWCHCLVDVNCVVFRLPCIVSCHGDILIEKAKETGARVCRGAIPNSLFARFVLLAAKYCPGVHRVEAFPSPACQCIVSKKLFH